MALTKQARRLRIKRRIKKKIQGTAERPRLSIFRSNKHIYAQIVDDIGNKTLTSASSLEKEITDNKDIDKNGQASLVGKAVAKKAVENNITKVVFDRNGYLYHGRVKSLAEGAREGGLKF